MSTERPSFGINSILPTNYKAKAEAFARCLQDKLRLLGCPDEPIENGHKSDSTGTENLRQFTDQEIAENVFLQGPLSYKRKSLPENNTKLLTNGKSRGKYVVSVVDRRGLSSDSEDSETDDRDPTPIEHPRVAELQTNASERKRLPSNNSVDSTSSWWSCDDGDNHDDDDEVADSLASQIKGSPTISNSRMRNFKRKAREDSKIAKAEKQTSLPENDLFFDFDMDCFSPVNVENDEGDDGVKELESSDLRISTEKETCITSDVDTGQIGITVPNVLTPPPSPISNSITQNYSSEDFKIHTRSESGYDSNELLHSADDTESSKTSCEDISVLEYGLDYNRKSHNNLSNESIDNLESSEGSFEKILDSNPETDPEFIDVSSKPKFDDISNVEDSNQETDLRNEFIDNLEVDPKICTTNLDFCEEVTEAYAGSNKNDVISDESTGLTPNEDSLIFNATEPNTLPECDITAAEVEVPDSTKSEEEAENETEINTTKCKVVITDSDDIEIDESYLPPPRMKLRRCSSLKTWKTPPGTPGRKKIVRFADALGLDLADVRTFLDEIPKIPNSAYEDLHYELPTTAPPPRVERTLIPMFQQPNSMMDFLQRVRQNNVSLESAILTDAALLAISGIIRVRNISFHKSVHVRYTKDSWATFSDLQATYIPNSSDGFCDNFSFTLYGHTMNVGDRLEFAIRYDCGSGQYWDSNGGANYCFQCMLRSPTPFFPLLSASPVDTWTKFY